MDKLKFIGWVIGGMVVAYIFITIMMPFLVDVTGDTVTEIQTSPNAAAYGLTIFGIRYFNLIIYFVPAVVGIAAIVFKLRRDRKQP